MEGQKYVLEGRVLCQPERTSSSPSGKKEGVEMASHAKKALGVDSFWDLKVGFIRYDLDLAASRWDEVEDGSVV